MEELSVLEECEKTSATSEKLILLKNNKSERLEQLVEATYNYERKYFLKKIVVNESNPTNEDKHEQFLSLLQLLQSREMVGNEAQRRVSLFFKYCNELQMKWYSRILTRDLKCGASIETFIKAGYNFPVFEVRLATDYNKCKTVNNLLRNKLYYCPKYDGYRCISIIESGYVTLLSRNGEVFENFPIIEDLLLSKIASIYPNIVLDGEIVSDSFDSMQRSAFASKRGTTVGDMSYHIFDCVSLEEWKSNNFKEKYLTRMENLSTLFDKCNINNEKMLIKVPFGELTTEEQVRELTVEYIDKGYEGIMLNPNITYYRGKKSNALLKSKLQKSMEAKIVGFYLGEFDTKFSSTLGGLNVIQENGITCDVSSGLSEVERNEIWNNKETHLNKIIEVRYQELTKDGRMRFPVFRRFRNDKDI